MMSNVLDLTLTASPIARGAMHQSISVPRRIASVLCMGIVIDKEFSKLFFLV